MGDMDMGWDDGNKWLMGDDDVDKANTRAWFDGFGVFLWMWFVSHSAPFSRISLDSKGLSKSKCVYTYPVVSSEYFN